MTISTEEKSFVCYDLKYWMQRPLEVRLCLLQETRSFLYSEVSSKTVIMREKHELHNVSVESPEAKLPRNLELFKTSTWNELLQIKAQMQRLGPNPNTPEVLKVFNPWWIWGGGSSLATGLVFWKQDLSICSVLQFRIQTGLYPSNALKHAHTLEGPAGVFLNQDQEAT